MMSDLILHRILKAPRSAVYACWTRPEHMVHWFMPKPHFLSDISIDLRPGGQFSSKMHVDGNVIDSQGCVLNAVQDELFAWTDLMSADFQPLATPGLGFSATIRFSDHPDGTDYHVTARHRTLAEAEQHDAMGFSQGWGMVATQLEAYAAGLAADLDSRAIVLTRRLDATAAQVWAAWTDPAILPLWFGPEGYHCVTKEIDLRTGGVWRFDMIGPDGKIWPNRHRITLHQPMTEIRYLLDDGDDSGRNPPMEAVITLFPEAGGTRLTQTLTLASAEAKTGALAFGADKLGETTLDKLEAILAG